MATSHLNNLQTSERITQQFVHTRSSSGGGGAGGVGWVRWSPPPGTVYGSVAS